LHEIDTPGVIKSVSELFQEHPNLLLGFNHFLPEGFKIEIPPAGVPTAVTFPQEHVNPLSEPENFPSPTQTRSRTTRQHAATTSTSSPSPRISSVISDPLEKPSESPPQVVPDYPKPPISPQITPQPSPTLQPQISAQKSQPELDHARNYVKKIKVRFELKPEIYKSFLRILHTYHEEHHTITDVYEQVAKLFEMHPDLLQEFKAFLPDSTPRETYASSRPRRTKATRVPRGESPPAKRAKLSNEHSQVNAEAIAFFESVKEQLSPNVQIYQEFLKCVHLFNQDIISHYDLMVLCVDLFSDYPDVYEEIREFCKFSEEDLIFSPGASSDEGAPSTPMNSNSTPMNPNSTPRVPQSEISPKRPSTLDETSLISLAAINSRNDVDWSTCKKHGPSYRELPPSYQHHTCSGRNGMCRSVLNDLWVSVPTGSEEGSFKASRKNQYEEILFKCEDERFELDREIELNSSCMNAFWIIIHQIQSCSQDQLNSFRIEEGLDILHLRCLERVYGEKSPLVLQALVKNPVVAVPVIMRRLQQKDLEWRMARNERNKIWREVNQKNFLKSLDHQSGFFKQREKKALNHRELLGEISSLKLIYAHDKLLDRTEQRPEGRLSLIFSWEPSCLIHDLIHLLTIQIQKTGAHQVEQDKMQVFVKGFLRQIFGGSKKTQSNSSLVGVQNSSESVSCVALFFGNDSFYILFRFMVIILSRLAHVFTMAKKILIDQQTPLRSSLNRMESNVMTFPSDIEMYRYYLNEILLPFISGSLDSLNYEDRCRELFGISSYILFTMDRLLKAVVKQVRAIFLGEVSSKLVHLHQYEESRSNVILESIYQSNALDLTRNESCFKFTLAERDGVKEFTMNLLDSSEPGIVNLTLSKETFLNTDLETLSAADKDRIRKTHVFLLRNRTKTVGRKPNKVFVKNDLECKVCMKTFRLFYVEETEDFFYRSGQLARAKLYKQNPKI